MGVSGCGKSTIGKAIAKQLSIPFYDGDDFHPQENIDKMSLKIPLTDEDRLPWLNLISQNIKKWNIKNSAVLACSCLKKKYREIVSKNNDVIFIYLKTDILTIKKRLQTRKEHFFPLELVQSQFDILEVDDSLITVESNKNKQLVVDEILQTIERKSINE
jgi:carbohydrate kinase (thermoresistant glucokinase family)